MAAAFSSPSLASASALSMDWPANVISPETGAPRLVQKQVVRVKATASEALVVLYLRLAVPVSAVTQNFQLFPDEGVTLKSSQVYPVNMSKDGRAVIPPEASRHLQRAAEVLAINRAPTSASSSSLQQTQDVQAASRTKKAKITTSNFHVTFLVPPDTNRLSSQKGEDRSHFVAVIQLAVPFTLTPPKWPYMVRIPVARSLNNYLNFTVDESCVQDNTIVQVDPPLLPKPTPMMGLKSKPKSDIEAAEAKEEADEDQRLSGPFYSTTSLCIRWARADAGKDGGGAERTSTSTQLIQAESLQVTAAFSGLRRVEDNIAEVFVQAQLTLRGAHYPGLDSTANIKVEIEAPSGSSWKTETVSAVPSKQSGPAFRSFSASHPANASVHSLRPGSLIRSRAEQIRSPSPVSSSSGASDEIQEVDTTLDEEGNLLDVKPPKGITSTELYSSSDNEEDGDATSNLAKMPSKSRRYSLGQSTPNGRSIPSFTHHSTSGKSRTIYITLNVAALSLGAEDFNCSLEAVIKIPIKKDQDSTDGIRVTMPLIKAQGIALKLDATLHGASFEASPLEKDVKRNGVDTKCHISLPANPSPAEIHNARIEVLADENLSDGNTDRAALQKPSPDFSEDSDDPFANRSFQDQGQTAQVDSLSGMIQEAGVEVFSAATVHDNLLQMERPQKSIKTTHILRLSWPSSPASTTSSDATGSLLPRIVFALPCSNDSELQILAASINGHSVHIEENTTSTARTSSSRIIDLQLPQSFKGAAKVNLFLLYMQESSILDSLCLFPPVASSIAELSITLHHKAFDSQEPSLSFSNQPVNLYHHTYQDASFIKKTTAHMVPSMTSITTDFLTLAKPIVLTAPANEAGPLRRTLNDKDTGDKRNFLFSILGPYFHIICTAILAIAVLSTFLNLDPMIGSLSRKVDSLAMALNVDFSDGSWKPDTNTAIPVDQARSPTVSESPRDATFATEEEKSHESILTSKHSEPHDLSIDTTSFTLLLQHLSLRLTRTLSWPVRFFRNILGRFTTA